MAAGGRHTCALTNANVAWCWGAADRGQLGDGQSGEPSSRRVNPQMPFALSGIGRSLGDGQCGWNADGVVACWGDNRRGQSDPFSGEDIVLPSIIALPAPAVMVASGEDHSCALLEGGFVRCWGSDDDGQIGDFALYE